MRNRQFSKAIYILPNLFTTLNMLCGFYAIVITIQSVATEEIMFSKAAALILLGAIFDSVDGRLARMMKTTSLFGIEYDSLADLTTFCLAPALLLYTWCLSSFDRIGWLAMFLYFGCGALRLARFNSQAQSKEKRFFQGLPTPMAAGLLITTVLLHDKLELAPPIEKAYLLFVTYAVAILMVSNVRYRSFKNINLIKQSSFSVMIVLLLALVILVAKPILTLFLAFVSYASLGILEAFVPKSWSPSIERFFSEYFLENKPLRRRKKSSETRPDLTDTPSIL